MMDLTQFLSGVVNKKPVIIINNDSPMQKSYITDLLERLLKMMAKKNMGIDEIKNKIPTSSAMG